MADPQTYAELKDAVIAWLLRDDLENLVPQFISLAERRFNRVLRVPEMEVVASAPVSAGVVTLPTDFLQARSLYVSIDDTTDYSVSPEQRTIAQLRELFPVDQIGYPPRYYALQSGDELVLAPQPDDDTNASVVLNYYAKIPALSDTNATNWLLLSNPDLYLAASLVEGFTHTRDMENMGLWQQRVNGILGELQNQGVKKAYSGPLRMRTQPMRQAYSNL